MVSFKVALPIRYGETYGICRTPIGCNETKNAGESVALPGKVTILKVPSPLSTKAGPDSMPAKESRKSRVALLTTWIGPESESSKISSGSSKALQH